MNEKVSRFFSKHWRFFVVVLLVVLSVVAGCTLCTPSFDVLVKNVKVIQRPYSAQPSVKP